MLSDISQELTTLLAADYGEDVREAIKDALSKINNNTIPTIDVTGVKGDLESEYRKGNVNITKANIGLSSVDNTSDMSKPVSNAQQQALQNIMMKSVTVSGTMATINANANTRYICGEMSELEFNPPQAGIANVIFTSGSSRTILTLPNTVKMPDWFEVEADMIYEISIADGVYGVVTSWAV